VHFGSSDCVRREWFDGLGGWKVLELVTYSKESMYMLYPPSDAIQEKGFFIPDLKRKGTRILNRQRANQFRRSDLG
jgi:hypothetical protein